MGTGTRRRPASAAAVDQAAPFGVWQKGDRTVTASSPTRATALEFDGFRRVAAPTRAELDTATATPEPTIDAGVPDLPASEQS